ncbi:MAG TPA: ATP-dependent endonuclease [Rubrivivax sp.]|nr:ATP-dependent endonuclease [Rubrivivax sp.]
MVDPKRMPGPRPPLTTAAACELVQRLDARVAILVEGWSDQAALETLAQRHRHDLRAQGIVVLPIGGVTNIAHFVQALGPSPGLDRALAGLFDAAEVEVVIRGLRRLQIGAADLAPHNLESLGFYVCNPDLEGELIRAIGGVGVEQILKAEGELDSFRRFQTQPAQRGRDHAAQLHRFLGTRAGRKIRYGSLLVEALELHKVPRVLDRVLAHALAGHRDKSQPLT